MQHDPIKKPVKLLVGHMNPDMDVIGAMWLFIKFDKRQFEQAQMYFVRAGDEITAEELSAKGLKRDEVVHVDTGLGMFDHHQPGHTERDSATLLVYEYLCDKYPDLVDDEALARVVDFVNETDHFGSYDWPEGDHDRYHFMLESILGGLRSGKQFNDRELVEFGSICLDGIYVSMKIQVSAERDLSGEVLEFETIWGKGLAIENSNDEVMKLAMKRGYMIVVRKDMERGSVRIKAAPVPEIELRSVYEEIVRRDTKGKWFYHPGGHMVLNSSEKNGDSEATTLGLQELVDIVKEHSEN